MGKLEEPPLEHREYRLVRCFWKQGMTLPREFNPRRVILIGSGAVLNSWAPVMRVFRENPPVRGLTEIQNSQYFRCQDFAAHVLANMSFMYRAFRNDVLDKGLRSKLKAESFRAYKQGIESFVHLRRNIADVYKKKNEDEFGKKIQLRTEICRILAMNDKSSTGVITTNWDELLWERNTDFPNLVQLHGRVSHERSVIFPTELMTDESVIKDMDFENEIPHQKDAAVSKQELISFLKDTCSRGDDLTYLSQAHDTAVHWLCSAEEIIVWGLGFNLYDAELNTVVSSANNPNEPLKKLTVIGVSKKHAEHVARVNMFPIDQLKFEDIASRSILKKIKRRFGLNLCRSS